MMHPRTIFVLTLMLISTIVLRAQQVFPGGGSGSYRLNYPGWNYAHHIYAPIGDNTTSHIHRGPNYTGPFQTHNWWNSALWDRGNIVVNDAAKTLTDLGHQRHSNPMYPHPLFLQAAAEGYILRYGTVDINGLNDEIECHSAVIDLRVGLSGQTANETMVDSYGDWHAVFYQNYGSGNTLRMTGAKGSPYAFFQRTGTQNPTIYGLGKDVVTKSTSGNSFIIRVAPEGRNLYFGVFFPPGTLIGNNGAPVTPITALPLGVYGCCWDNMVFGMPAGNNYFSVALMPNTTQATLNMYEARAFNFITGTTHSYNFNEATSRLTTTFQVTTTPVYGGANIGTLQALHKHQYLYSPEAAGAANTGLTYMSPRGPMRVLNTNTFTTVMTHQGILPNLAWAHRYNPVQMRAYIDNYLPTVAIPQNPADGYNKDGLVDLANIAQIAGQIGYTFAQNRCLDALQQRLTNWFTAPMGEDWALFIYNNNFNWLAHYPNGFTSSGEFIDMHFHMAYLIYGAAILARYRPAWANQYRGMVETMIRQINDYRKDNTAPAGGIGWFPYLRSFDPYAGHSWADPAATNQESVSEALLFASGTFLWGETIGDNNLRNLGALLYITESEAAKLYWFDVQENVNYNWGGTTYPQHHMTILRSNGGSYATFFSADNRWKHSIVLLPQSAGSLWQVWSPTQAQTMFNHLPGGGYPAWDDHGYHYNFLHAGFNPTAARNAFNTYVNTEQWINPTFPHVNGDIPVLYQWVNTFDSVGVYDNTVQADITGFSVFRKGDCRHYMIYMPRGKGPRTVNFTDGRSFNVPDDTVIVYRVCGDPLPVEWLDVSAYHVNNNHVQVKWSTATEKNNAHFEIERSQDGKSWKKIGAQGGSNHSATVVNYNFDDYEAAEGLNYYRIKQIDNDLRSAYSKIVSVYVGENTLNNIYYYPNPLNDFLTLHSSRNYLSHYKFRLTDLLGREYDLHIHSQTNEHQCTFDVANLSSGIYILEITDQVKGERMSYKLVKQP